jgi:hypothetical protein
MVIELGLARYRFIASAVMRTTKHYGRLSLAFGWRKLRKPEEHRLSIPAKSLAEQ